MIDWLIGQLADLLIGWLLASLWHSTMWIMSDSVAVKKSSGAGGLKGSFPVSLVFMLITLTATALGHGPEERDILRWYGRGLGGGRVVKENKAKNKIK